MRLNTLIENKAVYVNYAVPVDLCDKTVEKIEAESEFKSCLVNDKYNSEYRNSLEVKIRDKNLTNEFWKYICQYVPSMFDNAKLIGPDHNRVYLLKYQEGQFFKRHYDGFSEDSEGNKSKLTAMIYLNTVNSGGATRFYAEPNRNIYLPGFKEMFDIDPQIGKLLLFEHRLLHEGMPVTEGFKYCIRFNILYSKYESLKYTFAKMRINDTEVILTPDRNNKASRSRWFEVCMRPHVFCIKQEFPGFVDTTMGRPPTLEEDFCPNCYEILSLRNNYTKCPSCKSPVLSVDENQRKLI